MGKQYHILFLPSTVLRYGNRPYSSTQLASQQFLQITLLRHKFCGYNFGRDVFATLWLIISLNNNNVNIKNVFLCIVRLYKHIKTMKAVAICTRLYE